MSKIIIDGVEIPSEKLEALGWNPPETKEIEIPCGCPVLVWNYRKDVDFTETFYTEGMEDNYKHVEIDYQRKGAVIPWHGGVRPIKPGLRVSVT